MPPSSTASALKRLASEVYKLTGAMNNLAKSINGFVKSQGPNDIVNPDLYKGGGMQTGKSYFEDVILWHKAVGFPVRRTPAVFVGEAEHESREFGMRLVKEEFKELCDAFNDGNYRGIADGGGDLIWVTCALMARMGFDLDAAWKEIRRTNWDKVGGPRRADGKILKPEGWKPPSMEVAVRGIAMGTDCEWGSCGVCGADKDFKGRCTNGGCLHNVRPQNKVAHGEKKVPHQSKPSD
jgi:hypothetical protein